MNKRRTLSTIKQAKAERLPRLDLSDPQSKGLKEIPWEVTELTELEHLSLAYWERCADLRPVAALTKLRSLDLSSCLNLTDLTPLAALTSLELLKLSFCRNIVDLRPLSALLLLERLDLDGCELLVDTTPLAHLLELVSLNLSNCERLVDIQFLSALGSLQHLDLSFCSQLNDVGPLATLPSLLSLELFGCSHLENISALAELSSLESLTLGPCQSLQDYTPLDRLQSLRSLSVYDLSDGVRLNTLTSLEYLDLSESSALTDLSCLRRLTSLRHLNLSRCTGLQSLAPLSRLALLESLIVEGCTAIRSVGPLSQLTSLELLNLTACDGIADLRPLASLTALRHLYLPGCPLITDLRPLAALSCLESLELSELTNLRDVRPLTTLTELTTLHLCKCKQVTDLEPLRCLISLRELNLYGCEQITDLRPLSALQLLEKLYLHECSALVDLSPLNGLPRLHTLILSDCPALTHFAPLQQSLPTLNELKLHGCAFVDLPVEVCGDPYENVIDQVRAYYADLRRGATIDTEVRVLTLGNTATGKTQLCRRLRGLSFDPMVPSSHGIEVFDTPFDWKGLPFPVRINLWDFGGQENYHGSHSLFLQGHAVVMILWNPDSEDAESTVAEEPGRPLAYWLDYVRAFSGTETSVVVIQSQCDTPAQRGRPPSAVTRVSDFVSLQSVQASAKTGLGLDAVKAALTEAVRDLFANRPPTPIGTGRVRVRARIRDMLAAGTRWISRAAFDQICAEQNDVTDTEALLQFLHHSGILFYRRGMFDRRLILDQNWALRAVYAPFERVRALPALLRTGGRFQRSDLEALVWSEYSLEEQMVFLEMMEACGVCFRARQLEWDGWEYIAPELLPDRSVAEEELLAGRLLEAQPTAEAECEYAFLHDGLLRLFLSQVGRQAGNAAVYWKYGCWFYERTTASRVLIYASWRDSAIQFGGGSVKFSGWGAGAGRLVDALVTVLQSIPSGYGVQTTRRPAVTTSLTLADLRAEEALRPGSGPKTVYVSYAWEDASCAIVDTICRQLRDEGWHVIRDRDTLRYGDLISTFIKTMTRADCIVVLLSAKYLRSPYCMAELYGIYQRAGGDRDDFLKRLVPLAMKDVEFGTWRERAQIAKYWRGEFEAMDAQRSHLGTSDLSLYKAIQDWHGRIGDILAYVSDVLRPMRLEGINDSQWRELLAMLIVSPRNLEQLKNWSG